MSLAHFDEVLEICCEMMEMEEKATKEKVLAERFDPLHDLRSEGYKWWEAEVGERELEKEKELLHV